MICINFKPSVRVGVASKPRTVVVTCSAGKSDKLREVRKHLLEVRKKFEEKRMVSFKTVLESLKTLADTEIAFVKDLAVNIKPEESEPPTTTEPPPPSSDKP